MFAFLRALGVEGASNLGGWLLRTLGPKTGTHRTVMRNLRIAFPAMAEAERQQLAIDQWEGTGRTFAELAVMDKLTPDGGRVEVVGIDRLHALRDGGKPAVLISGHLANFEVMAAVIMAAGVPCQVTYRAANNPYVDALIRESRERYGIRLFAPKGDGTRELMVGMKRGDSIALLVDQKYNEGPEVQFFGQPVNASPGAARLALKFGTVMQPLSVVRLPGARFRVTAHEPITVEDTGDKAGDILRGVQAANLFVEDRVREHPVDWFWVHKRWPDRVYAALYGITGGTAQYYNNVGYSYMLRGNVPAALTSFRKARALDPDNIVVANNIQILQNAAAANRA